MSTLPLPDEPSLEQLRNQARELQRAVRSSDEDALAQVDERYPGPSFHPAAADSFRLSAAQLVMARRYGFESWTRLRRHVDIVERYSRFPARLLSADQGDLADQFLRKACLNYDGEGPADWAQAQAPAANPAEFMAALREYRK